MSRQWSEWKEVEEGDEDSVYSIHQVLSFLRGAYRDRAYEKAERLLIIREERIRDEMAEDVKRKVEVEERLMQLEKQCEELRAENVRLRDEEKRKAEMCEKLKRKMIEMEEDVKERVKGVEMKAEVEVGLRKKAEEDLLVSETKLKELGERVLSLQKDIDLLRSLEVEAQGSGMEVENNWNAELEVEAEVQAPVRVQSDQFAEGKNPTSPLSAAKHGIIEISSSDDDLESRLKCKSGFAPVRLDFESNIPSESCNNSLEVSSGIKRKSTSSNYEDKTEGIPQPSAGERTTPHLVTQEGNKKVQPSSVSLTPPPGFGFMKHVNSGQAEGTSKGPRSSLDDEEYKRAFLEKLKQHWDEVSSDSKLVSQMANRKNNIALTLNNGTQDTTYSGFAQVDIRR